MKERDRSRKQPAPRGVSETPRKHSQAASSTPLVQRLDAWIKPLAIWFAMAVFLISLGIRVLYYEQSKDTPLKAIYTGDISDQEFFHRWALHISEGDWLCDTVLHPYHSWHADFARGYFESYPDTAAAYYARFTSSTAGVDTLLARKALVNDYYNGKVYHQEPL